ncbi:Tetraspanin-3 [Zostera marina]|uniref:Tetraspanin-3 n=1 Tax=Zostera marina TaxID=29655 RepID=A0A0K9P653_ZOSMR|nr:Tetraspanin-3 [Zostera marina]
MFRRSNAVVGFINFVTFLISIPILGAGIFLATKANTGECLRFLQWPLIIISIAIMIVSLAGFIGACYRKTWLLRAYLFFMFFILVALLVFIIFAFAVTDKGSGHPVLGREYEEYSLDDYSGWLKDRVGGREYWSKISDCLRGAKVCKDMRRIVKIPPSSTAPATFVPESADSFYTRKLSPIQSGCCKPPTSCGFLYMNETFWNPAGSTSVAALGGDIDCTRWSNDQQLLCYNCDSCKAGVLASVKKSWRKAAVISIAVLVISIIVYIIAIAAFRNNLRMNNGEPQGINRMTKSHPHRFNF